MLVGQLGVTWPCVLEEEHVGDFWYYFQRQLYRLVAMWLATVAEAAAGNLLGALSWVDATAAATAVAAVSMCVCVYVCEDRGREFV